MVQTMVDPYSVLGVQQNAEPEVIDSAYRTLMKKYHPDISGPDGLEKAKAITLAYAAVKGRLSEQPVPGASGLGPEEPPRTAPELEPYEWDYDEYVPTPPLRLGVRLGFAVLVMIGVIALGAIL